MPASTLNSCIEIYKREGDQAPDLREVGSQSDMTIAKNDLQVHDGIIMPRVRNVVNEGLRRGPQILDELPHSSSRHRRPEPLPKASCIYGSLLQRARQSRFGVYNRV